MLSRVSLALYATTTFLTPLQVSFAQEANAGACSIMTIVSDAGEITWNTEEAAAELISIAKETNLTPEEAHELCHGEAVTQQAESDEVVEEDKVEDVASAEEAAEADENDQSDGIGVSALLPLAALGLGGGGGGGSTISDGTYRNTISGDYGTEYSYQSMLSSINPLSLNDYGYTGAGIKVGVVDTGIDSTHAEFDGKTIYGFDFASSGTGYGVDGNGHGTHVASIIAGERDGSGMRGVAYDATLYDYKVDNDNGGTLEGVSTDAEIAAVFNRHVSDNINVSNNSWGDSGVITSYSESSLRSTYSNTITAMRAAQNNGTLIVVIAHNYGNFHPNILGGLPYRVSELADEWLTVVSVDSSFTETNYTSRCGVAADFCVTAPGGGDSQATDGILAAQEWDICAI